MDVGVWSVVVSWDPMDYILPGSYVSRILQKTEVGIRLGASQVA